MLSRPSLLLLAALALSAPLAGCAYNADLGRQQMLIVNDSGLAAQGEKAWAETLRTGLVSSDTRRNARIRAVGQRVVSAAGLDNRPWDYAVLIDEAPNAFVLPGGHIGVTVGLLDMVDNDDQLAAVIGHEAGHVVAQHAAERYSQSVTSKLLLGVAGAAAGTSTDFGRSLGSYGGDATKYLFLLPFSRKHELEADRLGVGYMQRAGYKPSDAVKLWRKMQALGGPSGRPEIASTHPSDASRIAALQAYISSKGW